MVSLTEKNIFAIVFYVNKKKQNKCFTTNYHAFPLLLHKSTITRIGKQNHNLTKA